MKIRLAEKKEAEQIAEIHKTEIKKGFLSSLRGPFLTNLYSAIIESEFSFCVVSEKDGRVVGFIAGVLDINKFYGYFLKKYFFQSVLMLLPQIFNFKKLKKIFESLFYPKKENNLPKAELLTIAVKKEFQGQGIAKQMFEKFVSEIKNRKVGIFKVIVGEELKPAIKFYEKNGFQFLKKISIHNKQASRVYVYPIN
ncbi:GNAT family N-acetyltransferase [Candidatus Parcubacteria bacterium]|nr:GNAT family N-acetyltransferase [Candidatus Parcubacteria bacterium]